VLAGLALAAAVGLLITKAGTHVSGVKTQFADTRGYGVWQVLVAVQLVLWAAVAAIGGHRLRLAQISRTDFRRLSLAYLGVAIFAAFVVGVAPLTLNLHVGAPEPGHQLRIGVLDALGLLAAWGPAVGLLHVWSQATGSELHPDLPRSPRAISGRIEALWTDLQVYLALLGVMIAAVVFTTSSLAQAVAAAPAGSFRNGAKPPVQSPAVQIIYGLAWAAFVAALWAPAFVSVRKVAAEAVDALHPIPDSSLSSDWPEILDTRARVGAALHASDSVIDALRSGILILAPLTGSFLALLLPK
jgi:hypothetical protein